MGYELTCMVDASFQRKVPWIQIFRPTQIWISTSSRSGIWKRHVQITPRETVVRGMTNKPKLRILVTVKRTYEPEQYLKNHTKKGLWPLFAQLRLGSRPLSVEVVCFAWLCLDQRICPLCMEHNLVEGE